MRCLSPNLTGLWTRRFARRKPRPRRTKCPARRAHLTAEALIIIPILLIVSIGIIELGLLLSLKQSVSHAAIRGVRVAAQGAELSVVEDAIEGALGGFDVTLAADAGYVIEDPALLSTIPGGSISCVPPTTALSNGNVRVTVCATSNASPVSGVISKFGAFNFMDKVLTKSAVAKRECP